MKIVFVGGGSHRYLGIARSVLATPGLMHDGCITLYDPAVARAESVGRMIAKCPEMRDTNCQIVWGKSLDESLDGADVVTVVLMAGGRKSHGVCERVCRQHGFIGSDQLSPSGAILALKGGPILMDIATRMQRLCPRAVLVDFANPVAVLSAAVNNHTSITCLGVCAGFVNHQWDLTRVLFGKDQQWTDYDIRCAGVNHLSFILPGSTHRGRDLYELTAQRLHAEWTPPTLSERWNEAAKQNIRNSVTTLVQLYRKFGYLVFSTEGDGLAHLDIEGHYARGAKPEPPVSAAELEARVKAGELARAEADRKFAAWIDRDIDVATWNATTPETADLQRNDEDGMVRVIRAVGGAASMSLATSFPNRGAVRGFKDRTVLEYSQVLDHNGLRPTGTLEVPDVFQGLISDLATHQTLLGDAIATRDPRLLFQAFYNYPVARDTAAAKALWRELLAVSASDIPSEFQLTRDMF